MMSEPGTVVPGIVVSEVVALAEAAALAATLRWLIPTIPPKNVAIVCRALT